jgi:hypothetical protein
MISFSLLKDLGIVFSSLDFLMVVLPPISLEHFVSFLVLVVGLVDCLEGTTSSFFLDIGTFFGITGTFHSSGPSFMAHYTSSPVTQYLNCSHSFLGSLLAWIHMLCLEALKYVIPWFSLTTFGGILHVLANFSYISSNIMEKCGNFPSFSSDLKCAIVLYTSLHDTFLASGKICLYFGSPYPTKAINIINHE